MSRHREPHAAALAGVLGCMALALLLVHSLAGGTLLAVNYYDSYALQAENWLAGRDFILHGEEYPWLELAVYNGKYYQSFPPVPAVLELPWVLAAGGTARVPSNLIIALWGLCMAAGVYACFRRQGASAQTAAYFSLFMGMGSNAFWLASDGGVWFLAQIAGLCLTVWGIFYALGDTSAGRAMASLCFALAVGCRPFYAVPAAWWGLRCVRTAWQKRTGWRSLLPVVLPAAAVAAGLMAYNFARFGSLLEFGHSYLPEFQRAEHGQFHWSYLWPNLLGLLRPVTLDNKLQLQFPLFQGFLPFAANPLFTLWLGCGLKAWREKRPAERTSALPGHGGALALAAVGVCLCYCLHRTMGAWQFGARYTVDLLPYALLWFLHRPNWRPGAAAWALCGAAVLFNFYGAVYMWSVR